MEIALSAEEAAHLSQSRRLQPGESCFVQGTDEKRFRAQVIRVGPRTATVLIQEAVDTPPEPKRDLILFLALTKEKALDAVLQKATELGVTRVIIWNSERTPERLPSRALGRVARWQKITSEAAKQSGRVHGAEVVFLAERELLTGHLAAISTRYLLASDSRTSLAQELDNQATKSTSIAIIVGPEGGLNEEEVQWFIGQGALPVSVGPRTLRAETAAIAAAALAQAWCGDLA
ncbi:MAG: hypothetical protein A2542_01220 [Parcubacteria group bacterium RIFOXYD2_FULL_52_8]|nr:MAG: hypothetical protein A2542_01220 [Parcubacteria group bacterium RIFOXYD2_FULL_52_8]